MGFILADLFTRAVNNIWINPKAHNFKFKKERFLGLIGNEICSFSENIQVCISEERYAGQNNS